MRIANITSQAQTCARACAIALGFSIPISTALDNVLLAAILLLWIASAGYSDKLAQIMHNRVALAALALFALLIAGLAYGTRNPGDGLSYLIKYSDLAFVPVFVTLFSTERSRHYAWLAFAAALAVTVLLSYLIWLGIVADIPWLRGTHQNPEVFKRYLTQSFFLAFGAYLFAHFAARAHSIAERRAWIALTLLAAFNVLVLTQGRTGQLVVFALTLYYAFFKWRWKGLAIAASIVALVLALLVGFGGASRLTATPEELQNFSSAQPAASSTGLRMEFYRNSLEIARAHPWFGTGTGSFPKVYAAQVAGSAMTATTNPHDEYLNVAIQLGVVGLLALLYIFYCAWRHAPLLPTVPERHLARALVITFVVGCAFNSLLMDHAEGLLFAWAAGLLFAGLKPPANIAERAA